MRIWAVVKPRMVSRGQVMERVEHAAKELKLHFFSKEMWEIVCLFFQ